MRESNIVTAIIKYLRHNYPGCVVWKIHEDSVYGVIGIPDVYFAYAGKSVWFEVKTPTGKRSKIQEVVLRDLRNNGIPCQFVYSVEDVKIFLEKHL